MMGVILTSVACVLVAIVFCIIWWNSPEIEDEIEDVQARREWANRQAALYRDLMVDPQEEWDLARNIP
jgi:hypothetical protein